jgi:hypothetical protein
MYLESFLDLLDDCYFSFIERSFEIFLKIVNCSPISYEEFFCRWSTSDGEFTNISLHYGRPFGPLQYCGKTKTKMKKL